MPQMGRQCNAVAQMTPTSGESHETALRRIEACKRTAMAAQATITRSGPWLGASMLRCRWGIVGEPGEIAGCPEVLVHSGRGRCGCGAKSV